MTPAVMTPEATAELDALLARSNAQELAGLLARQSASANADANRARRAELMTMPGLERGLGAIGAATMRGLKGPPDLALDAADFFGMNTDAAREMTGTTDRDLLELKRNAHDLNSGGTNTLGGVGMDVATGMVQFAPETVLTGMGGKASAFPRTVDDLLKAAGAGIALGGTTMAMGEPTTSQGPMLSLDTNSRAVNTALGATVGAVIPAAGYALRQAYTGPLDAMWRGLTGKHLLGVESMAKKAAADELVERLARARSVISDNPGVWETVKARLSGDIPGGDVSRANLMMQPRSVGAAQSAGTSLPKTTASELNDPNMMMLELERRAANPAAFSSADAERARAVLAAFEDALPDAQGAGHVQSLYDDAGKMYKRATLSLFGTEQSPKLSVTTKHQAQMFAQKLVADLGGSAKGQSIFRTPVAAIDDWAGRRGDKFSVFDLIELRKELNAAVRGQPGKAFEGMSKGDKGGLHVIRRIDNFLNSVSDYKYSKSVNADFAAAMRHAEGAEAQQRIRDAFINPTSPDNPTITGAQLKGNLGRYGEAKAGRGASRMTPKDMLPPGVRERLEWITHDLLTEDALRANVKKTATGGGGPMTAPLMQRWMSRIAGSDNSSSITRAILEASEGEPARQMDRMLADPNYFRQVMAETNADRPAYEGLRRLFGSNILSP